jgi:beta-glucosidase
MTKKQASNEITSRVDALLARMTLEEKIAQLGSCWMYELQTKGVLDPAKVEGKMKNGLGQLTRLAGASAYPPREAVKIGNQIQRYIQENTRLGIPLIIHEECCVGLVASGASIFPQIIGLASTFQPELARQMTTGIRGEMLAIGARQGLAPVLDVARDPRWGRIEETFGEDPTLVGQFSMEYVKGLQSDDLRQGVLATGKHFVGHSFSLGGMNCAPVQLGWHELYDVYLAPFHAAIRDAGLATMMNAYPELDGEVVAASKKVLTDLLRDTLGFDGLVVSDYEAVMMIHNYHYAAQTRKEAAVRALSAGLDVELPSVACYGEDLLDAIQSGELPEDILDLSVRRHLQKKFELGLFENPYVDEEAVISLMDTPANRELAYQIACQSMVLLKNDGILPLNPSGLKLAVIGPNADTSRCMMGDYSYTSMAELLMALPDENSSASALTENDLRAHTVPVPTFAQALRQSFPSMTLHMARGCDVDSPDESGFGEAVQAAQASDVVVMVMGGISGLAPHSTTGEFHDTTQLGLPGVQEKLVKTILATGKPVVLVLIDGRPVSMPDLVEATPAILEAWVPGEEGARAIVDTLFGAVNPGGKLPVSVPRSVGQIPVFYNHKPSGMRSNIYGDYVNEKATPLFPFGFGLSYTSFDYVNLQIAQNSVAAGESVDISLTVTNSGGVAGDEVVQLYLRDEYASLPRPVKELKGFVRVSLQPGEEKTVCFHLPVNQMAFFDRDLELILEPGSFKVMVGSSSDDIRLTGSFEVTRGGRLAIGERVFVCPVEVA